MLFLCLLDLLGFRVDMALFCILGVRVETEERDTHAYTEIINTKNQIKK